MADRTEIIDIKVNASEAIRLLGEYNAQIDELKRKLKEAGDSADIDRAEQARLQEQLKATQAARRALSGEVQAGIKQEQAAKDSIRQKAAELAKLKKRWKEYSAEQRAAHQSDLQRIQALDKEVKQLEGELGEFQRNVGNYEGAINKAVFGNSQFGQSLAGIASQSGSFTAAMAAMKRSVMAFSKSLLGLLKNPVFLALSAVAGAVYAFKRLYEYNLEIAEATRLTREFLRVPEEQLPYYRSEVQAIADVWHLQFVDVLKATDAQMSEFGISAEEALRNIRDGLVAGADMNGDFLNNIQQYKGAFHDAGIEAKQMIAILAQTKSGIFSNEGLTAITKATQQIRRMSAQTQSALRGIGLDVDEITRKLKNGQMDIFDVLVLVSKQMQQMSPQSKEVGDVLQNVFGKQAAANGAQMVEEIGRMSTSLEELKGSATNYMKTQDELVEETRKVNQESETMFAGLSEGFVTVWQYAKIYGKKLALLVFGIFTWINKLIAYIVYGVSQGIRGIVTFILWVKDVVWGVAQVVWSALKSIGTQMIEFGKMMVSLMTLDFDGVAEHAKKMAQAVVNHFKDIGNIGKTTAHNIANEWGGALGGWGKGNDFILEFAQYSGSSEMFDDLKGVGADSIKRAEAQQMQLDESALNADDARKRLEDAVKNAGGKGGKGGNRAVKKAQDEYDKAVKEHEKALQKARKDIVERAEKEITDIMKKELDERAKTSREALLERQQQEANALDRDINLLLYGQDYSPDSADPETLQLTEEEKKAFENLAQLRQRMLERHEKELDEFDKKMAETNKKAVEETRKASEDMVRLRMEQLDSELGNGYWSPEDYAAKMEQRYFMETQLETLQYQKRLAEFEGNQEAQALIMQQWQERMLQLRREYNDKIHQQAQELADSEVEIERNKYEAMANLMGAFAEAAEVFQDKSKALAAAAKVLAVAQILISQGVAIAKAVETAAKSSWSWYETLAAITAVVAGVTAAMKTAMQSVKSAKFAGGGDVSGAGTGTSDSIPAMLSNGESVVNARSTAAYAPYLSAINQAGGGVPIYGQGVGQRAAQNDVIAQRMAAAVANIHPVVSVVDINEGQQRVEVIQRRAAI